MPRSWTDRELLDGVASREEGALRTFDEFFRPRLLAFAQKRGLHREDAQDAVQETLISAVAQIQAGFEPRTSLRAWISGILNKQCAESRRRQARRQRLLEPTADLAVIEATTPDGTTIETDVQLRVREALLALTPRERLVLLLNRQEELTAREIAGVLNLGKKVTEATLTRARKRFRELILADEEMHARKRLR